MRYVELYAADRPVSPGAERFAEAFLGRTGRTADYWGALSYDAAMVIGLAVHDVGPDRRRVRDRIAAVGRAAPAYDGVTGRVRFDARGDPVEKPVLVRTAGR